MLFQFFRVFGVIFGYFSLKRRRNFITISALARRIGSENINDPFLLLFRDRIKYRFVHKSCSYLRDPR